MKKKKTSPSHSRQFEKISRHIPDSQIDFSDIPELSSAELARARQINRSRRITTAFISLNPATGKILRRTPETTPAALRRLVSAAQRAFLDWREWPIAKRGEPVRALADLLIQNCDHLARLESREMGKPVGQARAEIEKCASASHFFADHAEAMLRPERIATEGSKSEIRFEPLGLILAVMPWNFPYWQVFRAAVPALLAGNAIIVKHAENVSGCALAIQEMMDRAGFPQGVYSSVFLPREKVLPLIDAPEICAVTLTGSTRAGKAIAMRAGRALKKSVLELGGCDPYLILDDADLDSAIPIAISSRLQNNGQSCIAAKRLITPLSQLAEIEKRVVAEIHKAKMGNPLDANTTLGPLARQDLRDALHCQVKKSIARGARLLAGGELPKGPGFFYPVTVLSDVKPGMPAFEEELFGPVVAIVPTRSEREAIQLANRSPYGLGAAVFSRDVARAEGVASRLEAGICAINTLVKSDPRLPFGGIKHSGYGRELGIFGIREFVNIKTLISR